MTFTFFPNIPNAPDYPGDDQPQMQTNAASTNSILAIDHVSFNTSNGGTHKQVTFSSENTPSSPMDPISVLYTATGTASTVADLRFINANGTFPISFTRAFVVLSAGAILNSQSFNVASIANGPAGSKVITFNGVTGMSFGVSGTNVGSINAFNFTISGNAQITVSSNSLTSSIIILQV